MMSRQHRLQRWAAASVLTSGMIVVAPVVSMAGPGDGGQSPWVFHLDTVSADPAAELAVAGTAGPAEELAQRTEDVTGGGAANRPVDDVLPDAGPSSAPGTAAAGPQHPAAHVQPPGDPARPIDVTLPGHDDDKTPPGHDSRIASADGGRAERQM